MQNNENINTNPNNTTNTNTNNTNTNNTNTNNTNPNPSNMNFPLEQITMITDQLNNHEERLNGQDIKINKNTDDIIEIKINTSVQGQVIADLNKNIEKLNQTIEKINDKIESYFSTESKSKIETWKVILISVMIPILLSLLNFISSHIIK